MGAIQSRALPPGCQADGLYAGLGFFTWRPQTDSLSADVCQSPIALFMTGEFLGGLIKGRIDIFCYFGPDLGFFYLDDFF
jgi:hypothetical protein